MANLKVPLLSLDARNTVSKAITFVKRRGRNIAEKKPEILDAKSPGQLAWRHMYQKCVALWHALSSAEKAEWESAARSRHMTGFAWFQSQCLRPNPGIYLPLQGGTMSGNIDMAKNRILKLPLPTDSQEPLTLAYYTANIDPYLYSEGARVYHNVTVAIPNATVTALSFNSQRYDTDSIHDPVTNNTRLTCKTAGKYVATGCIQFAANPTGIRLLAFQLNATTVIALHKVSTVVGDNIILGLATIYALALTDFLELLVYQNSGGALNLEYSPQITPEFSMQRIG